jgi:hypothetical protein
MFRFSIRELLTLTLVAALAVGWWLDHRAIAKQGATLRSELYLASDHATGLKQLVEDQGYKVKFEKSGDTWIAAPNGNRFTNALVIYGPVFHDPAGESP